MNHNYKCFLNRVAVKSDVYVSCRLQCKEQNKLVVSFEQKVFFSNHWLVFSEFRILSM